MGNLAGDLRYVLRVLWRQRTLNLVALLTLALAIGANTAIFSVVSALLLRPLPYPDSDRLMQVERRYRGGGVTGGATSVPKFVFWDAQAAGTFESLAAYDDFGSGFNLAGDTPERVVGSRVSACFFTALGTHPMLGRGFRAEDDRPGAAKVVVLSRGLWERRFGARADIIGQAITLNDEPFIVIGIQPESGSYPRNAALWTLFQFDRASRAPENFFKVIGRLRPGVPPAQAQERLSLATAQLRRESPDAAAEGEGVGVRPLQQAIYGDMRPALLMLLGAVGLVLLIACVNVANLQLAQAAARQREIALRTALGADAWRITRLLLLESLVLALAGGIVGAALARLAVPVLVSMGPSELAQVEGIGLDARVLLFASGVSLLAGMLFGILPAWQARRPDVEAVLRASAGGRSTGMRRGAWTGRALVAGEVGLALMLTIGAAMLLKSLVGLHHREPGFAADHVLTMKLSLPEGKYGDAAALARFEEAVETRVRALPSVRAAALAGSLPLELGPEFPFTIEGRSSHDANRGTGGADAAVGEAQTRLVGAGYFDTLRIPLRGGRWFDDRDRRGTLPVVIINDAIARRYWPKGDALGQRLTVGPPMRSELAETVPRLIVGIVGNVREEGLSLDPSPIVYLPMAQGHPPLVRQLVRVLPISLALRTEGEAATLAPAVQRAIWAIDPNQPVTNVLLMEEIVARSLGANRFNTLVLSLLAALALLLAAVGIYGVLSHLVSQRTREVGLRMALGASRGGVLALFLRQGLTLILFGIVVGLAGAAAMTKLLRSLVIDVSAYDPWLFLLSPLVLLVVAVLAIAGPALRAARIDPSHALRSE